MDEACCVMELFSPVSIQLGPGVVVSFAMWESVIGSVVDLVVSIGVSDVSAIFLNQR